MAARDRVVTATAAHLRWAHFSEGGPAEVMESPSDLGMMVCVIAYVFMGFVVRDWVMSN